MGVSLSATQELESEQAHREHGEQGEK
jgi:hypothetical protein